MSWFRKCLLFWEGLRTTQACPEDLAYDPWWVQEAGHNDIEMTHRQGSLRLWKKTALANRISSRAHDVLKDRVLRETTSVSEGFGSAREEPRILKKHKSEFALSRCVCGWVVEWPSAMLRRDMLKSAYSEDAADSSVPPSLGFFLFADVSAIKR